MFLKPRLFLDYFRDYIYNDYMLGQRDTPSSGYVVLVLMANVYKITTTEIEDYQIRSKYFISLIESSRNNDLVGEILIDVAKTKNMSFLKSIIDLAPTQFNLENHHDLISLLLLQDEQLFNVAMEKCQNKNACLRNGETFLTNLFKQGCSLEIIDRIIDKNIFDINVTNKRNESPLVLACQNVMVSTVEKIIKMSPLLPSHKEQAIQISVNALSEISNSNRSISDVIKIIAIINSAETFSKECSICRSRGSNIAFQCGNVSCEECFENLIKCPFCDEMITSTIKLYF